MSWKSGKIGCNFLGKMANRRCKEYDLAEAIVFNNDNMRVEGKIVYAPVYMAMFLERDHTAPACYKVDLSGLQ